MELDEADEMVSQMEIEIQGMPQSIKSKYQLRAKTNKTDLNKYKKQAVRHPFPYTLSDRLHITHVFALLETLHVTSA